MTLTSSAGVGVRASDGKLMWRNRSAANGTANATTPVFSNNTVFYTSSYGTGGALLSLTAQNGEVRAQEVYFTRDMQNHHGGVIVIGSTLYGFHNSIMAALDLPTGKSLWRNRSVGKGAITYADGRFYILGEDHVMGLAEATPAGYRETRPVPDRRPGMAVVGAPGGQRRAALHPQPGHAPGLRRSRPMTSVATGTSAGHSMTWAALNIAFIVLSHAASLAFAIYTTQRSGVRTQVVLYTFIIDYILRLVFDPAVVLLVTLGRTVGLRAAASALSRQPGERREAGAARGTELGPASWVCARGVTSALMALLSYFAFVLANVDADRQLGSDLATVLDDLDWAIVVGITYWVNALVDPDHRDRSEAGRRRRVSDTTRASSAILAVAVLVGGAVVAVRQMNGYHGRRRGR